MHLTGRWRLWALYMGVAAVVAKVAVSAGALAQSPAVTVMAWFAALTFAAIGVVLVATESSVESGWLCLAIAWGTVMGDLNSQELPVALSALGYLFEVSFLVAAVALCLTYPGPVRVRALAAAAALMAFVVATRTPLLWLDGPLGDGFWHPTGWHRTWQPALHDLLVRLGRGGTAVTLAGVAVALLAHMWRTRGLAREALASLSFLGALTAVGAALDQAVWVDEHLRRTVTFGGDLRNMAGALIPMALLAHLLRRQAARSAITETVLGAARTGDLRAVEVALSEVLSDPTLRLRIPTQGGDWRPLDGIEVHVDDGNRRGTYDVAAESGSAVRIEFDRRALDDPSILEPVAKALQLGMDNAELTAALKSHAHELAQSRARLATAALEERRRVERDLHDGAQQRLLAVVTKLAMAEVVGDDHLRGLITDARHQLGAGITELRNLARGIYPASLVQGGLTSALGDLVRESGAGFSLDVATDVARLPAEIEATAYFVVAEALANVNHHAPGASTSVWVAQLGADLLISVQDDGPGGDLSPTGTGLTGIRDRVAAVGGESHIHSDPCEAHRGRSGVTLNVRLPSAGHPDETPSGASVDSFVGKTQGG